MSSIHKRNKKRVVHLVDSEMTILKPGVSSLRRRCEKIKTLLQQNGTRVYGNYIDTENMSTGNQCCQQFVRLTMFPQIVVIKLTVGILGNNITVINIQMKLVQQELGAFQVAACRASKKCAYVSNGAVVVVKTTLIQNTAYVPFTD